MWNETGDYNYELKEKDWSKQLTKEEAEIYRSWFDLAYSQADDYDDEDISAEIAEQYDMDIDEVDSIIRKQIS